MGAPHLKKKDFFGNFKIMFSSKPFFLFKQNQATTHSPQNLSKLVLFYVLWLLRCKLLFCSFYCFVVSCLNKKKALFFAQNQHFHFFLSAIHKTTFTSFHTIWIDSKSILCDFYFVFTAYFDCLDLSLTRLLLNKRAQVCCVFQPDFQTRGRWVGIVRDTISL